MTQSHEQRMRELVESGEKAQMGVLYVTPPGHVDDEASIWEERTGSRIADSSTCAPSDQRRFNFFAAAANARPAIALATEGMKALKEWRECERKMNNVSNDTNDYHSAYNALVAAWRRIDKLLAQWEEGT